MPKKLDCNSATTDANTAQIKKDQKKKRCNGRDPRNDISEITCYNCHKKGHYSKNCTKPKNKFQFRRSLC